MIEMKWVWHDFKDGAPKTGSVCVGERLYQKLKYRTIVNPDELNRVWSDWIDVPHCGMPTNA